MYSRTIHRARRGRLRQQFLLRALSCCAALAAGAGLFVMTSGMDFAGSGAPVLPVLAAENGTFFEEQDGAAAAENFSGWQLTDNGWNFLDEAGEPVKGLQQIKGDTYYFDADGLMLTGFCDTPQGRCFFGTSGRMAVGTFTYGGKRYLAGKDGILLTGWQQNENGETCYCYKDGSVATGKAVINGASYLFDGDGVLQTGWCEEEGGWTYRNAQGIAAVGLTVIDDDTYYFDTDGARQTGFVETAEGCRYFDDSGAMVTGETTVNGARLQFGADGIMMEKAELTVQVIYQNPALPNGCEVTSLAQVLRYNGFDAAHTALAKDYLRCEPMVFKDGVCYIADPEEAYIGDPATAQGWYCYEGPVIEAANRYLADQGSALTARSVTGADQQALLSHLQSGRPVIVWVTQNLADVRRSSYLWTLPDGTVEHPYSGLHCVVLSGMDAEAGTCTLTDPIYGVQTVELARFMEIYEEMGSRAVVLE